MFKRHINQRLHEEHDATLALWGKVERSLASGKTDLGLLYGAAAALGHEVAHHFDFEETALFPRLAAAGEGDLGELLAEEHVAIRAAAKRFAELMRSDPSHAHVRPLALELAERLASHIQKEEMSLLPALEDLLDDEADGQLAARYAAA